MKNNKLFAGSGVALSAVAIAVAAVTFNVSETYQPRASKVFKKSNAKGIAGAVEYYASIRNNQVTGELNINDVLAAQEQVKALARSRSSGVNLAWDELGPDNVGGRTRAFAIDPITPTIMYAGGVAGGLWKSTNAGGTWSKINDQAENLAVSAITIAANGDIYYGTGEGLANPGGINFNSGTIGAGIFKSTDGGNNFTQLASTKPTSANSDNDTWALVYDIVAHPTNASIIYAGTGKGVRVSEDGGATWKDDYVFIDGTSIKLASRVSDIEANADGSIALVGGTTIYISPTGAAGTFEKKATGLPSSFGRADIAIAPSNSNVMYAAIAKGDGSLSGVYYTADKGANWSAILPGGSAFDPFGSNKQGWYDNIIAVHPTREGEVIFGGVELHQWKRVSATPVSGQWERIATEFPDDPNNPTYVHSDKHNVIYHPTDTTKVFILTDGGVFQNFTRSQQSGFFAQNKGYNTTQFYGFGYSGLGEVLGGTQDNGTQYIDFTHPNGKLGAVEVTGGDGGHSEISQLDNNILFSTIYYGDVYRSNDKGKSVNGFRSSIVASLGGSFVTAIRLWESFDDPNSPDSVSFKADLMSETIGTGNAKATNFTGTLKPTQTSALIEAGTVVIKSGTLKLIDNGNGLLTGDGTGTINYATKAVNVTFNSAPGQSTLVMASYGTRYNAGSVVSLKSKTLDFPISYTLPFDLGYGDSVLVHDRTQSKFALGVSGSVWVTKRALDFASDISWIKAATIGGTAQHIEFSKDGNIMYTASGGSLYRTVGMSQLKDNMKTATAASAPPSVLQTTLIKSFSQSITGIGVDPKNNDHLIVTLGNYGNTNYVYRSTNATGAATFTSVQGNLPKMPVYSVVIDKAAGSNKVILGTEFGMYATEDITAGAATQWVDNNNGMPRVPVYMVRQQTMENNWPKITNSGVIYAATHGRGFFKTNTLASFGTNVDEKAAITAKVSGLKVYPNPASTNGNVVVTLAAPVEKATVTFFDLNGKTVKTINTGSLREGNHNLSFNVSELPVGTYFVRFDGGATTLSSKLVIIR